MGTIKHVEGDVLPIKRFHVLPSYDYDLDTMEAAQAEVQELCEDENYDGSPWMIMECVAITKRDKVLIVPYTKDVELED